MALRLRGDAPDFGRAFEAFLAARRDAQDDVRAAVAVILADVQRRGDAAVLEYTQRYDRLDLSPEAMRLSSAELAAAEAEVPEEVGAALRLAAERIEAFHRLQELPALHRVDAAGVELAARWTPIDAVGIYVPGGLAAYPSSVLMNAIPARVAGVPRLAMAVPAPEGRLNPLVLAAARLAGVDEVYRIGGAQAIGALAFGTATVPAVDKIVGPGNAFVAEAKRQVFGRVGIDLVAGPSEVVVVADAATDPRWIAIDLLAQAEHDTAAQSVLITDDAGFADRVTAAVDDLLRTLPRADIARASWERHGAVIVLRRLDEAPTLVDRLAPEHLQLAVAEPHSLADRVRHAGAIFLGRHTPEAIGDYVAGPNHVLPTGRTARFASGLNLLDFVKRTTLVGCDAAALRAIGPAAVALAEAEGLAAHATSVAMRLEAG